MKYYFLTLVQVNRINELATRHQNYGSLFYNQDGFSGALSSMPTPANLPRMSIEDEELMWDILDLTSSSSLIESRDIHDLAPQPGGDVTTNYSHSFKSPITSTLQSRGHDHEPGSSNFASQAESILGEEASSLIEHGSAGEWPFANRASNHAFGSGVPDIPDWMIFGDFMTEHL